jgi:DNA-binding transcriptional regulator PaaX
MPVQDAEWETEENAFNELLQRHDTCDAKDCLCPDGRKYVAFFLVILSYRGAELDPDRIYYIRIRIQHFLRKVLMSDPEV